MSTLAKDLADQLTALNQEHDRLTAQLSRTLHILQIAPYSDNAYQVANQQRNLTTKLKSLTQQIRELEAELSPNEKHDRRTTNGRDRQKTSCQS